MITNQIVQKSIDQLTAITGVGLSVADPEGNCVADTLEGGVSAALITKFNATSADREVADGYIFERVKDGNETIYIIAAKENSESSHQVIRIAVSQLEALVEAYMENYDSNSFYQNLLLDNLLMVDIYNRAKKLGIHGSRKRCVFIVKINSKNDVSAIETLKMLFNKGEKGSEDIVTSVEENKIVVIRLLDEDETYDEMYETAQSIRALMESELMIDVVVSYGTIVLDLKDVSRSFKEAQMALDVGRIFYADKRIVPYNTLGIGRLIYQLPPSLCEIFMKEVFGDNIPNNLDEETLSTIDKFFENNLNVSETSRQLYVHRNTLVYRIEKLMKNTGLDIRNFDDALTLKIALMVISYMKYTEANL